MYYLVNQKREVVYSSESKLDVQAIKELHRHDDAEITDKKPIMNKPTAIIISQKGSFSVHNTFSRACSLYGWDRSKFRTIPKEVKGYKITQIPFDVSIDCLELMEFISRKNTVLDYENHYSEDGDFHVEISGYHIAYSMKVKVNRVEEKPWDNGNDGGYNETGGGYYRFEGEEIIQVLDTNGDPMVVDEHTKEFLLDLVDIEETEDYD